MFTPDWNDLILLQDWAEALKKILADAAGATAASRQAVAEVLKTFVKLSPFSAGALDDIATRAIIDLNTSTIIDLAAAIAARSAELKTQIELIEGVTSQAGTDAQGLRLDGVNKVLANAKMALNAIKTANSALGNPDAALTKKIDAVVKAIDGLAK